MARPAGRKNADYQEKRHALACAVMAALLEAGPERPSLRELSRVTGVQVNTLRHYFGNREGVIEAAFEVMSQRGGPHVERTLALLELPVDEALERLVEGIVTSWKPGMLAGMHAAGMAEGMGQPTLGPAYVESLLEPTLQTFEALLQGFMDRGELRDGDARVAALALFTPVLFALIHQQELGGEACRPLDMPAFLAAHLEAFLAGWSATPQAMRLASGA